MKVKNKNPYGLLKGNDQIHPIIEFYFQFNQLKHLFRQGWLLKGVPENKCESVADHLFGVTILALFIAEKYFPNLDLLKIVRMSLIHELGEVFLGDITPHDKIKREDKRMWERQALIKTMSKVDNRAMYIKLWDEYEEGFSPEGRLLRQIDYLEMSLQAKIYQLQYNMNPQEFFNFTKKHLKDKELIDLFKKLQQIS